MDALVHAAHADAWQAEGTARAACGGGIRSWPGVRAMASGIPTPKWNNADLTRADVDLDAVAAWYAALGMPWGIRAPLDAGVSAGRHLFVKRCMARGVETPRPQAPPEKRRLSRPDLPAFAALEQRAFGDPPDAVHAWLAPRFAAGGSTFGHWLLLAEDDSPRAIASTVTTADVAGPAIMISGIGLVDTGQVEPARATIDVLAALVDAVSRRASADLPSASGAYLLHAYPDDEVETAALAACGFVETSGLEVRLMTR